jgi:hypothetical protein
MVEIYHAVKPIMAGDAALAKILDVINHEDSILFSMTSHAAQAVKPKFWRQDMTGGTIHGSGCVVHIVPEQTEFRLCMVKLSQCELGWVVVPPAMLCVAFSTAADVINLGVSAGLQVDLIQYALVTDKAELILGGFHRRMATAALTFEFSMRAERFQNNARLDLGTELTRTESYSACLPDVRA